MNLPNKLTLIRILAAPLFVACFYTGWPIANYVAAGIFILAFITDIFDGYLARKHNIVTNFGKMADPIADKLLVVSALVMLVDRAMLHPVIAIIIIARELIISGLRVMTAAKGSVLAANILGKLKTISQIIAISLLLLGNPVFGLLGIPMDTIFVWIALIMTVWSGADYIRHNFGAIDFK